MNVVATRGGMGAASGGVTRDMLQLSISIG
jgi:hypothetical protein